jgi:hypothetical protein
MLVVSDARNRSQELTPRTVVFCQGGRVSLASASELP